MKPTLDSLKYAITYIDLDGERDIEYFDFFKQAMERYNICREIYDTTRLTMVQKITIETRIL
jgi:hypothetical protein